MAISDTAGGCPAEVAGPVLRILSEAIKIIRIASRNNESKYCAIDANHIHNLPGLLRCYSRGSLEYYLDAERTSYIHELGELGRFQDMAEQFRPMWVELERYLGREPA
jgi:hypothetical protein